MINTKAISGIRSAVLALAFGVLIAGNASGQDQQWTLDISDGAASVNGKVLGTDSLPKSLDLKGISLHLSMPSFANPVVAIGDAVYVIEKDRIRDATPEEIDKNGVFASSRLSDTDARNLIFTSLKEIERNAAFVPSEQVQASVRGNAMRAGQMVAAIPHLEMRSYWNGVRENDDALYQSLVKEAQVEGEVSELVEIIRVLPPGSPREKAIDDLRVQLTALFDMKQENRRREISELEEQLQTLTKRMIAREKMRKPIVEQRMKELLGPSYH